MITDRPPVATPAIVNIPQRLSIDCDGTTYPITNWFDADGDECEPEDAIAAVAGSGGHWITILLKDFGPESIQ